MVASKPSRSREPTTLTWSLVVFRLLVTLRGALVAFYLAEYFGLASLGITNYVFMSQVPETWDVIVEGKCN